MHECILTHLTLHVCLFPELIGDVRYTYVPATDQTNRDPSRCRLQVRVLTIFMPFTFAPAQSSFHRTSKEITRRAASETALASFFGMTTATTMTTETTTTDGKLQHYCPWSENQLNGLSFASQHFFSKEEESIPGGWNRRRRARREMDFIPERSLKKTNCETFRSQAQESLKFFS